MGFWRSLRGEWGPSAPAFLLVHLLANEQVRGAPGARDQLSASHRDCLPSVVLSLLCTSLPVCTTGVTL